MMLFRRAHSSDLEQIHHLSLYSGVGMTTLPKSKELLAQRLNWSTQSYKKEPLHASDEYYLFVLEDSETQKVVGTSAIEACTGFHVPFYSYKLSKHTYLSHSLNIRNEVHILDLVNDNEGRSELCTLFLDPEYRKDHNGMLLSKARFLFMAFAPQRFAATIIAELRGVCNEQGLSPFWNHLAAHFFPMSFAKADELTLSTDKQFIADLMPKSPIYVSLLPQEAQQVIGTSHASTIPAMSMLLSEGFHYNNYIDIFDGGPTIEAPLKDIKTIMHNKLLPIKAIAAVDEKEPKYLVANNKLDFRATLNTVHIDNEQQTCIITKELADLLQVNTGDSIRLRALP